jgi:hypothetical protein
MMSRKVYIIESGQLGVREADRYELGVREAFTSLKGAKKTIEQEIEINKGNTPVIEEYEIGNQKVIQYDYQWYTKEGREVSIRTLIRIIDLKTY